MNLFIGIIIMVRKSMLSVYSYHKITELRYACALIVKKLWFEVTDIFVFEELVTYCVV